MLDAVLCVALVGGVGLSFHLARLDHRAQAARQRAAVKAQLETLSGELSRELFGAIQLTQGIAGLIAIEGGISEEKFRALTSELLERSDLIRNVALAPGDVVRLVHPIAGNEAAIGLEYARHPEQGPIVERMKRERRMVVAGPVPLVQGGIGVIGRTPIYLTGTDNTGEPDAYWGLSSTVLDFDALIARTRLQSVSESLALLLRGRDGTGPDGAVFWGDSTVLTAAPATVSVPLPSGNWQLAGLPRTGWIAFDPLRALPFWTGSLITLLLAALLYRLQASMEARERATESLRESETRHRAMIEHASDLVSVLDSHGVIRFQGPSCERLLGVPPARWLGQSLVALADPEDAAGIARAIENALGHPGRAIPFEFRVRHRNGEWCHFEAIGRNVPEQSSAGYLVVNSRDATEGRKLKEQLLQSQKLEAVGQLAGGVAHDFNNVLTAMLLQLDLLAAEKQLPEPLGRGLREVRADAERAATLTRQLLLFSRRQVLQSRAHDLSQIVQRMTRLLQRTIGEQIELKLVLHPAPLVVDADAGMLEQVLLNLALNARDAMPDGGRLLIETIARNVTAAEPPPDPEVFPGPYFGFCVSDEGGGVPPEIRSRIFEPFFSTKEIGRGTGLGLATAFGIVKQHGGWIELQSAPGAGARSCVYLPARVGHCVVSAPDRPESAPVPRGGSECVLLVEDDPAVRTLMHTMLERHGYRVLVASDGPQALEIWSERSAEIALLLTDLVMPGGVGGQALAQRLRCERASLRVVYASGYSAEIAGRNFALGRHEHFLPKPCTLRELLGVVREALDARA